MKYFVTVTSECVNKNGHFFNSDYYEGVFEIEADGITDAIMKCIENEFTALLCEPINWYFDGSAMIETDNREISDFKDYFFDCVSEEDC